MSHASKIAAQSFRCSVDRPSRQRAA
jgi:hypothetical protein